MQPQSGQPPGQDHIPSLSSPRLLSHKPRSQVIQCDYTDETGHSIPCFVKLFSPRARVAYEKELDVYSLAEAQKPNLTASKLWSGLWTANQYQSLLAGNLPSMLRRHENQVRVLVLSFIPNSIPLSRVDSSNRVHAVKAALNALRQLHSSGIVHGDPSCDNVLIQRIGDRTTATWVDFSASITKPSEVDVSHEWQKSLEYFSQFSDVPSSSLSQIEDAAPNLSTEGQSKTPEPRPPLPKIHPGVTFSDFEYVGEGTHAVVYKVSARRNNKQYTRCLKIFQKGWDTPYMLETTAYAYLRRAGVEEFVPKFYGYDLRTPAQWGLTRIMDESDGEFYGILLEWLEGAEQLSEQNINLDIVVDFMVGLTHIHNAGILHNDIFERNMLVVPETKRSVWIDFSCAKIGSEDYHDQESQALAGFTFGALMDRSKEDGRAEVYEKYYLSTIPLFRRICSSIYVAWLFIEGSVSAFHQFTRSRSPELVAYGMEHSIMYVTIAGLLLVLLHTYIGCRLPRYFFRSMVFIHQITIAALSLWRYICSETQDQVGTGFRLFLLCFCALGETEAFVAGMIETIMLPRLEE